MIGPNGGPGRIRTVRLKRQSVATESGTDLTRRRAAVLLLVAVATGCAWMSGATPVADVGTAQRVTDELVAGVGAQPDSREVLERTNNQINTLADTVMSRWEDFPDRDDPIETWARALRDANLTITHRSDSYPTGRPNSGNTDVPELRACLPGSDPPVGVNVSIGQVGESVSVAMEVGGPPATAGC